MLLASALVTLTGCGGDSAGPSDVDCNAFLLTYGAAAGDTVTATQGLRYIEITPGSGVAVSQGIAVEFNYSGYLLSGTRFDTSCSAEAPVLRFTVGAGQLIPGFELGVLGMKPGGVRRIIVPPALGYGSTANGPIPANSTLVFDLEMIRYP
jgi:peptidylprolyl isomerase